MTETLSHTDSSHKVHNCPSNIRDFIKGTKRPPKHPEYSEYVARLDSYVSWPGKYVPQKPEKLASAGFYYIGSADRVTCFQCGITLRDWEEGHDPEVEHREYSPNCAFISQPDLNQLGVATRFLSEDLQTDSADMTCAIQGLDLCAYSAGDIPHLTTDIVKEAEDMGFSTGQIHKASEMFRKLENRECKNVTELVDAILNMEEQVSHTEKKISQKSSTYMATDHCNNVSHTQPATLYKQLSQSGDLNNTSKAEKPKTKLTPLVAENRRLRDRKTCRLCRQQDVSILFLPCGHLVTCGACADKTETCIVCHKIILGTVKTYFT